MKVSKIIESEEFKREIDVKTREIIREYEWAAVKVREDLTRLMDYLKIEFQDVPANPSKRIVAKKTKKRKHTTYINLQEAFNRMSDAQAWAVHNTYRGIPWR